MLLKLNMQGLLIYAAMALYALSLAAWLVRRKLGLGLFAGGFIAVVLAVAYRGWHVGHAPLQNLFEVFLVCGGLVFPLAVFCRAVLKVGGEAVAFLAPAGLVFSDQPQHLPPILQSVLFVPHVTAYLLALVILTKAGIVAGAVLLLGPDNRLGDERAIRKLVKLAFPLLTAGLVLGAVWGRRAWGDYWNWDPKELWSLASWLVYLGYFHLRYVSQRRRARTEAAIAVLGFVVIVTTLLWVNLSKLFAGLHSYA